MSESSRATPYHSSSAETLTQGQLPASRVARTTSPAHRWPQTGAELQGAERTRTAPEALPSARTRRARSSWSRARPSSDASRSRCCSLRCAGVSRRAGCRSKSRRPTPSAEARTMASKSARPPLILLQCRSHHVPSVSPEAPRPSGGTPDDAPRAGWTATPGARTSTDSPRPPLPAAAAQPASVLPSRSSSRGTLHDMRRRSPPGLKYDSANGRTSASQSRSATSSWRQRWGRSPPAAAPAVSGWAAQAAAKLARSQCATTRLWSNQAAKASRALTAWR
mmetsp:Transcript_86112/g.256947  ORF Transcript_86112/g.256947 Transcript_86112/m.256947 type:complete len:279 (-) Transcript_86112:178-1014(-)